VNDLSLGLTATTFPMNSARMNTGVDRRDIQHGWISCEAKCRALELDMETQYDSTHLFRIGTMAGMIAMEGREKSNLNV
jgi:hypothetical protein